MKKNVILLMSLICLLIGCQQNKKAECLFNGRDLRHWYAFDKEKGKFDDAKERFEISNNIIHLYGKTSAYLMSRDVFKDFILTVEYRWNEDKNLPRRIDVRNSGVMYLIPEGTRDTIWPRGLQCQIKEGSSGDFILIDYFGLSVNGEKIPRGESVVVERTGGKENDFGEWNRIEIKVDNGKITQKLNGKICNQGTDPSVEKGHILIQYEGYPLDIKSITLENI